MATQVATQMATVVAKRQQGPGRPSSRGRTNRVLLAEPDPVLRAEVAAALSGDGFELIEASNHDELLTHVHLLHRDAGAPPFDLVICSASLDALGIDGVVQGLRNPRIASSLVLISAGGYLAAAARALHLGATALLQWPKDVVRLRALLTPASPHAA